MEILWPFLTGSARIRGTKADNANLEKVPWWYITLNTKPPSNSKYQNFRDTEIHGI